MMTYIILYKFYSPIFHKNTIFHLHLQIAKKKHLSFKVEQVNMRSYANSTYLI